MRHRRTSRLNRSEFLHREPTWQLVVAAPPHLETAQNAGLLAFGLPEPIACQRPRCRDPCTSVRQLAPTREMGAVGTETSEEAEDPCGLSAAVANLWATSLEAEVRCCVLGLNRWHRSQHAGNGSFALGKYPSSVVPEHAEVFAIPAHEVHAWRTLQRLDWLDQAIELGDKMCKANSVRVLQTPGSESGTSQRHKGQDRRQRAWHPAQGRASLEPT